MHENVALEMLFKQLVAELIEQEEQVYCPPTCQHVTDAPSSIMVSPQGLSTVTSRHREPKG